MHRVLGQTPILISTTVPVYIYNNIKLTLDPGKNQTYEVESGLIKLTVLESILDYSTRILSSYRKKILSDPHRWNRMV